MEIATNQDGRRLKIGFYLKAFPVLSETFIHRQIASLILDGHEVEVIAERKAEGKVVHSTVLKHGLLDRATFLLSGSNSKDCFAAAGLMAKSPLRAVKAAGEARRIGVRQAIRNVAADSRLPARKSYDALIAHFGPAAVSAARLLQSGTVSAPLISVFHGYDLTSYVRENGRDVYEYLFSKSAFCLAISDRWANRLTELGCPAEKVGVHRVGLNVGGIEYRPRMKAGSPLKLLSVARMVEKKGIEFGLRAVARTSSEIPVIYDVVGDGPLLPGLRSLAERLGISGSVRFHGALPEQVVMNRMVESDGLLVPSVVAADGDEEGIPVVIMEAMASGLPVVATRHSGIPELVEDGVTGFLAPEKDIDAMARTLRRMSEKDLSGICNEARLKVERLHDASVLSRELADFIRTAVGESNV